MLTEIKGGHHTRAHTHTSTYKHTSNIFYSSKQAAGESVLYIYIFNCSSFPSSLPIREVLLLPRWLHPSIPLTASWGVLLVEAAGSLFRYTAPTLACSNATPLWGQRKVALTCIYVFLPCVVNSAARHSLLSSCRVLSAQYLLACQHLCFFRL